ncbi:RagB/SusD family nutrient uptake outer membrane protein [Puia dinghuensis]|uniref:Membrane protein n=1 Tax=Puia dinghuensis TaxID=1792502 RepID=A0A8J2UI07_9BACT|nr:RagB/SusD family nutrient uptake outer membrane protein [Puia dinghuensis]GGB20831.1 membrane protein [Puia dinghuensis]
MKQIVRYSLIIAAMALGQSCKKDFLNRPPKDATTSANFYTTDAEVMAGTAPLYGIVWFDYNDKAFLSFGEAHGGNLNCDDADRKGYISFSVPQTDDILPTGYEAFWKVVAQSNLVMANIANAKTTADATTKQMGIAECRFMRGLSYMYLVSNWGPVPIVYNNTTQLTDSTIKPNDLPSVWKLIIMDLAYAANHLPTTPFQQGRLTKWSAEGMLAKAYLYRSGLNQSEGSRTQSDLDSSKYYAADVINNSGASLLPSYYNLFTHAYNSTAFANPNPENLFSLLWMPASSPWGINNSFQAYVAFESSITQTGDGWGGAFGASSSILQYYMAHPEDSIRRKATFMLPGDKYPELNAANGGTAVPAGNFNTGGNDHAYVKKYVIGSPADNNGGTTMAAYENTYMLRLAEVYLNYAEAILGNSASTSDATALQYFNAVRTRAGVAPLASIAFSDIFQERKIEFAFEGMEWYDWVHWYYFAPAKALAYFSSQNRGHYNIIYNGPHNYTVTYAGTTYPMTAGTVYLPWPETELELNPNLNGAPVPFDFSKLPNY